VYAQDSGGETDSLRVTVRQEQPVLAYDLALLREALRIIRGTTDVDDPYQRSPCSASHGLSLLPGRGQGSRWVCMCSPAQYHIGQDDGDIRITGSLDQGLSARTRVDHRVWPALGKFLCSQIQYHMRGLR
jgi:hypothetical protein